MLDEHYIAGLIDGEGCLDITRQSYTSTLTRKKKEYFYPRLTISNNNLEVIEMIQSHFNCGQIYSDKKKLYILVFHNKDCELVLRKIGHLLIVKREELKVLQKFFNNKERSELYHIELKNMRRGYVA